MQFLQEIAVPWGLTFDRQLAITLRIVEIFTEVKGRQSYPEAGVLLL
jgi:hypothetical protein